MINTRECFIVYDLQYEFLLYFKNESVVGGLVGNQDFWDYKFFEIVCDIIYICLFLGKEVQKFFDRVLERFIDFQFKIRLFLKLFGCYF